MDPNLIKQLLLSTGKDTGPRVKLQRIVAVKVEMQKVDYSQDKSPGCALCGCSGSAKCNLPEPSLLDIYFPIFFPLLQKAAPYCQSCMMAVKKIRDLIEREIQLQEELESKTAAMRMIFKMKNCSPETKGLKVKFELPEELCRREILDDSAFSTDQNENLDKNVKTNETSIDVNPFVGVDWMSSNMNHEGDEVITEAALPQIGKKVRSITSKSNSDPMDERKKTTASASTNESATESVSRKEREQKPGSSGNFVKSNRKSKGKFCQKCKKWFYRDFVIKGHFHKKDGTAFFRCHRCGHTFPKSAGLSQHYHHYCEVVRDWKIRCSKCNKGFHSLKARRIHENVVHKVPSKCYFCGKIYAQRRILTDHLRKHTMEAPTYPCNLCGRTFFLKLSARNHTQFTCRKNLESTAVQALSRCRFKQRKKSNETNFHSEIRNAELERTDKLWCKVCGKIFSTAEEYYKHRRHSCRVKVNGPGSAKCETCSLEFSTNTAKYIHEQRVHGSKVIVECYFCKTTFPSAWKLFNHLRKHTAEVTIHHCPLCGKTFVSKAYCNEHINLHCLKRKEAAGFNDAYARSRVLNEHRKELGMTGTQKLAPKGYRKAKLKCDVCGIRFVLEYIRRSHFHKADGTSAFKCEECEMEFRSRNVFIAHQNTCKKNHKERTFCMVCNISFNSFSKKILHDQREHSSTQRVHVCYFCCKVFVHPSSHTSHISRHTMEGSEECQKCGKTFNSKMTYRKHVILVCGTDKEEQKKLLQELASQQKRIRNYTMSCYFCKKKFKNRTFMFQHIKKHIKEYERFPCRQCGKVFSGEKNKKSHERRCNIEDHVQ